MFDYEDAEINERFMKENFPWTSDFNEPDGTLVRREIPHIAGVYIEGMVLGIETTITVDTGATKTLMSHATFCRIPETRKPSLHKCGTTVVADGRRMKTYGRAVFELVLGPLVMEKEIMVADMEDEVLLGADIIQFDPSGPADLMLSLGILIFRDPSIPVLQTGGPTKELKVRAADHYEIPPLSEMIVDAFILSNGSNSIK